MTEQREPQVLEFTKDLDLKKVSEPWVFTEENLAEAARLEEDMHHTLMHYTMPGLAHCQVGGDKRVICLQSLGCMFNPRIVFKTEQEHLMEEGSVSVPGLIVKIKRPFGLRVRFEIATGRTVTEPFNGMTARQVFHLMDFLDGTPFYDRASRFHRNQAFNKQKRFLKQHVRA